MSSGLWTAFEAASATGGALCSRGGDPDRWIAEEWVASGISIDTRTLAPGEIFVALADARDGHEFVRSAFERGAAAALVARASADFPEGAPLLLVDDTLAGLRRLAAAARDRNFGKRIAVTGSVGKTTTKEMLRAALAATGRVHAADRSFNNHFGVPLTLARMPMHADFGVFEVGMNHAGEITPLTRLVRPDVAIVTTVGEAHLEFFGSTEGIAEAKAEIFLGVRRGGAAVLPADNAHYGLLRRRAQEAGIERLVTFGETENADIRLAGYETDGRAGFIAALVMGRSVEFTLNAPGRHQALNALAVLGAAISLGAPVEATLGGLSAYGAVAGRGAQTTLHLPGGGEAVLLDESYNANPTSMAAALALLGAMRPRGSGRRVAILGDMLELGSSGVQLHVALAQNLVDARVDRLYAAGVLMEHLFDIAPASMRARAAQEAKALIPGLIDELRDGDIVMVKGSNGSKVSEIARTLCGLAGPSSTNTNDRA